MYTRDQTIDGSFDEVVDRTVEALADEGFGVMWEVDARATFDEKLDKPFRKYLILGSCAPDLAYDALGLEDRLGALLPCNVVVQESDSGQIELSIVDPVTLLNLVENPDLDPIIDEVSERIDRIINAIAV